jgi:hypothetical protein
VTSRRIACGVAGALVAALAVLGALLWHPFPSDRTAEGAYVRLARAVSEGNLETAFAYLEDDARDACYTVHRSRKEARELVAASFPEPERTDTMARYREEAEAGSGAAIFAKVAERRGWTARLRKDLSGVARIETDGDRATVVTARGARYTFRQQHDGGFGLTMFTAELVIDGNRAARDLDVVRKAADDYRRGTLR